MPRPSKFFPVSNRDLTPVLTPSVRARSLEQIVAHYMTTGDSSGLDPLGDESYDFPDSEKADFDIELPQSMNKIDAILHYRNIRDSVRSEMQYKKIDTKQPDTKQPDSAITDVSAESNTNDNGNPEQGA